MAGRAGSDGELPMSDEMTFRRVLHESLPAVRDLSIWLTDDLYGLRALVDVAADSRLPSTKSITLFGRIKGLNDLTALVEQAKALSIEAQP